MGLLGLADLHVFSEEPIKVCETIIRSMLESFAVLFLVMFNLYYEQYLRK